MITNRYHDLYVNAIGVDVLIANKLESTGLPGHIHISERTLALLWDYPLEILPGPPDAQTNPFLLKYDIKTFLIAGKTEDVFTNDISTETSIDPNDSQEDLIEEALHNEFATIPVGVIE